MYKISALYEIININVSTYYTVVRHLI